MIALCAAVVAALSVAHPAVSGAPVDSLNRPGVHQPSRSAASAFARAQDLAQRGDTTHALAALRQAIESDPEYMQAHEAFIALSRATLVVRDASFQMSRDHYLRVLVDQYASWAKRFPKSAGVELAIGQALEDTQDPRAKPHLLRAVALDPKLAPAYKALAGDARRWGDPAGARHYLEQAAAADPTEPSYAFFLAMDVLDSDPARGRRMIDSLVARFPASDVGPAALYELQERATSDSERIAILEQMRMRYPADRFDMVREVYLRGLFDAYARTAPEKGIALARDMVRASTDGFEQGMWARNATYALGMLEARSWMTAKKYAAASAVLSATSLPLFRDHDENFALVKAAAVDGAGHSQRAYEILVAQLARTPSDTVRSALAHYAQEIGKTPAQVDSAVWAVRDSTSVPASQFRLPKYTSADSASLADFRGKVVLVTVWFPGCGSCLEELPHFQHVMNRYQGHGVEYVGIDVEPDEDSYVLPFLRATRYTFVPLRGSDATMVNGRPPGAFPSNYLIDGRGRVIFSDFTTPDAASEHTLELMLQSMLAHGS